MAFHVPRSGIQAMMKKGTRYMDGKEEVVYDSIATIKGICIHFYGFYSATKCLAVRGLKYSIIEIGMIHQTPISITLR